MSISNPGRKRPARVEWPTVALIIVCHGGWLAAGILIWPVHPLLAIIMMGVMLALHSSLVHEALHGHPTRHAGLNEFLVSLPLGLVWPYRRFKAQHLRHHADDRLTDPFEDPESYYRAFWQHQALPSVLKTLLAINNTMLGRIVLGPLIATPAFLVSEWRLARRNVDGVRDAWLRHAAGLAVVLLIIHFAFQMPLWAYVLGPVWIGQGLIAIRTFAEHQWSERPDGRTIIVERSPLALLFLNNNLHLVHHKMPNVAWYRLPELFRARRAEWLRMNGNYVYPNYLALLSSFALKAKEPVVHPFLRRAPEPGRAFRPRVRSAVGLNGLGSVPVPAEPSKE